MSSSHEDVLHVVDPVNFTKNLDVVADLSVFTVRHPKTVLHTNDFRDMIMRCSAADGKMTFV